MLFSAAISFWNRVTKSEKKIGVGLMYFTTTQKARFSNTRISTTQITSHTTPIHMTFHLVFPLRGSGLLLLHFLFLFLFLIILSLFFLLFLIILLFLLFLVLFFFFNRLPILSNRVELNLLDMAEDACKYLSKRLCQAVAVHNNAGKRQCP